MRQPGDSDVAQRGVQSDSAAARDTLGDFLSKSSIVTVLTGAGVSTASGIPDYRDRNGESKVRAPIEYQAFVSSANMRRRYWARSYVGWQRFSEAAPNAAHEALAALEHAGKVDTLITQNVDGLHERAGNRRLINLHGELSKVVCLQCETRLPRLTYQRQLREANGDWQAKVFAVKPDGDAELAEASLDHFAVPDCEQCGGIIKPDVVMFGENVPRDRVADAMTAVERSDGLLVVGSSLMVFSGYRFARHAHELGQPIVIVNRGRTRADDIATIKLDVDCVSALAQ